MTASFISQGAVGAAITEKGALCGVIYTKVEGLAVPIPYEPAEYREGMAATARLLWESDVRKVQPGSAVTLRLWFDASDTSTGTGVLTTPMEVRLEAGSGAINFHGVRIQILGFESDGSIRYRIESQDAAQRVGFFYRPGVQIIYIYY